MDDQTNWAEVFTMEYADDVAVFPFVEDENANITGYGHQDLAAFAAEINRYDEVTDPSARLTDDLWTADDVTHGWVLPEPDGERLSVVASDTVGAIPVTTLWGAR